MTWLHDRYALSFLRFTSDLQLMHCGMSGRLAALEWFLSVLRLPIPGVFALAFCERAKNSRNGKDAQKIAQIKTLSRAHGSESKEGKGGKAMKKRMIETEDYGQILRDRLKCINLFPVFYLNVKMGRKERYTIKEARQ